MNKIKLKKAVRFVLCDMWELILFGLLDFAVKTVVGFFCVVGCGLIAIMAGGLIVHLFGWESLHLAGTVFLKSIPYTLAAMLIWEHLMNWAKGENDE